MPSAVKPYWYRNGLMSWGGVVIGSVEIMVTPLSWLVGIGVNQHLAEVHLGPVEIQYWHRR